MIGSARVSFKPIAVTIEDGEASIEVVFGGTLQAFTFGPQPPITPGPVELVFSAEYLTKARKPEISAVGEFAKLPGEVVVTDTGIEIQVSADAVLPVEQLSEIPDQDHPVVGKIPPLSLTLELGGGFRVLTVNGKKETRVNSNTSNAGTTKDATSKPAQAPAVTVARGRILIPPPDKPSKYLELMVSIKRDGADLAPPATNGRLDVSLLLLDFLVFEVEDEAGKKASDVDVEIVITNGEQITGKTDKDGRFALNGVPRGECDVLLPFGTHVKDESQEEESKAS